MLSAKGRPRRSEDDRQYMRELGARIAEVRALRRWTHPQLAARAGLSSGSVYAWEKGTKMPGALSIKLLAKAMNVNAGWLLRGPKDEEQR